MELWPLWQANGEHGEMVAGGRGCVWVKFKVAKVNVANLIWATQANLIKQSGRNIETVLPFFQVDAENVYFGKELEVR